MPHIQLDLTFLTHPKTITVSPLAQLLFIRSILYSAIHMTDGKIPHVAPHQLCWDMGRYDVQTGGVPGQFSVGHSVEAGELVDELVAIGWYEPYDGGYRIHHYLHYQLSRRQIHAISKERSKAGKASGLARREKINGKSYEQPVEQRVEQNANKNEPIPLPIPTPIPIEKEKKELSPSRARGKTALPQDLVLTEEERTGWDKFGINSAVEFAAFKDHARTEDRRCSDWEAAKRNWMRKAIRIKEEGRNRGMFQVR